MFSLVWFCTDTPDTTSSPLCCTPSFWAVLGWTVSAWATPALLWGSCWHWEASGSGGSWTWFSSSLEAWCPVIIATGALTTDTKVTVWSSFAQQTPIYDTHVKEYKHNEIWQAVGCVRFTVETPACIVGTKWTHTVKSTWFTHFEKAPHPPKMTEKPVYSLSYCSY